MGRVVFMCGPAGSGKSTYAQRLEADGFVRLSVDEEAWARGHRVQPLQPDVAAEIGAHLRRRLLDLVDSGRDVVLDYSFASRAVRDEYRRLLAPYGVTPETVYLATPREVALARVRSRTGGEANEVQLTEETAAAYYDGFEVPDPGEGPLTVVQHADAERGDLSGARFERADMSGATFRSVDLTGARFRGVSLIRAEMTGVELEHARIDGAIEGLVLNGVEVAPLVEAELDRRDPLRAAMRPTDPAGFREAWDILERLWSGTVDRARRLDPDLLHESVAEEWSFIETLRHLVFATDSWVRRVILGDPAPWHPLALPWDEMPDLPGIPRDREARPSLDEVLALRRDRMSGVRVVLDGLTDASLAADTEPVDAPGWPPPRSFPVRECLLIVLNEEWQHRLYAERDLAVLEGRV